MHAREAAAPRPSLDALGAAKERPARSLQRGSRAMNEPASMLAFAVAGAVAAVLYAAALARNAEMYLGPGSLTRALAWHLGRWVALAALFTLAALAGPRTLLATATGFALAHLPSLALARRRR
jgi:hypothetical protein